MYGGDRVEKTGNVTPICTLLWAGGVNPSGFSPVCGVEIVDVREE